MTNKMKNLLKSQSGSASFPLVIAVTLSLLLVFCGVSEYFRLLVIAQGVRDVMQSAVISKVNDNYINVYHSVREGYSGAYVPDDGDFIESADHDGIYEKIDHTLGLVKNGAGHEKYTAGDRLEFCIRDLKVDIQNAALASGDRPPERFSVYCSVALEVPVVFAGKSLPPMRMTVRSAAGYIPKF